MSGDMFKKMKDRITDEVNSATNKLQNMQIIDQLTSSIGQQIKNDVTPNQLLPEPHDSSHFGIYNEEEELNSDMSPQQQLFDEHSIRKANSKRTNRKARDMDSFKDSRQLDFNHDTQDDTLKNVINIDDLSSDLDEGLEDTLSVSTKEDGLDVEIDLLSDKPISNNDDKHDKILSQNILQFYRTRYRNLVHGFRKLSQESESKMSRLETEKQELSNQITAIRLELDNFRQQQQQINSEQNDSLLSVSTTSNNDKSSAGSPQPTTKSSSKIKDLERLLAKCKESLKQKNTIIQNLRESLSEVEKFKDCNQELKRELGELREAHETWTVSIAENKRVMHQEIENKNAELEKLKRESHEHQLLLNDSNNKIRQLKSAVQDLESRLVSTSAAHQKERESLTKELTITKNNAIRQLQKEHQHNIERVRLDLEKSIEALKVEILTKDEQTIKNAEQLQRLQEENSSLSMKLDESNLKFQNQAEVLKEVKENNERNIKKASELETELNNMREQLSELENLDSKNKELSAEIETLKEQLSTTESARLKLEEKLSCESSTKKECERCLTVQKDVDKNIESFQQELHQLNSKLQLMTTANEDQEKEIQSIRGERDILSENNKSIRFELEELLKKNEQLAQIIKENELDIQSQQDQLDKMSPLKQELESQKKENTSLSDNIGRIKLELSERNIELNQAKDQIVDLQSQLSILKADLKNTQTTLNDFKRDKDSLTQQNELLNKQKRDSDEQLVLRILSVMKNLETPTTSPGSDKSFSSIQRQDSSNRIEERLPNPNILMEELCSLALDKSNSCVTATQRLQAVLLDNSMLSEELRRLKDELNLLNRERTHEAQCSIEEVEKLRSENQALIHDQQAYDDRIKELEQELEDLTRELSDKKETEADLESKPQTPNDIKLKELEVAYEAKLSEIDELKSAIEHNDRNGSTENAVEQFESEKDTLMGRIQLLEEELKSCRPSEGSGDHTYQIKALQRVLNQYKEENHRLKEDQKNFSARLSNDHEVDVPDSTQFEYLKNIVYQFMLGKEPLILARVISAVFKFEKSQIEQICKTQEYLQSALKQVRQV